VKNDLTSCNNIKNKIALYRFYVEEQLVELRKEVKIVAKYIMTTFSREEIYNEIWTNTTSRTAKKYDVPYSKFTEACKKYKVPLPTNSYWSSLSIGKKVDKTPLLKLKSDEIILPVTIRSKDVIIEKIEKKKTNENPLEINPKSNYEVGIERNSSSEFNIYERNTLYEEIWSEPITKVAKRYGVSDSAIHKVCKSLNIPKPPAGYWRQIETGHKVPKIPLPPTDKAKTKKGARTTEINTDKISNQRILDFLSNSDKDRIISAALEISLNLSDEYTTLHPVLKKNKSNINKWRKEHKKDLLASRKRDTYYSPPKDEPPLYNDISEESLPRVYCLLDTLFKYVELLGGKVNDDLSLEIRGEKVTFQIIESESKVPHVKTKEELNKLEKYEKEKQKYSWVSKPQIRTWDYLFNGKIKISVFKGAYYKDTNTSLIESELGNILIDLYEKSELVRIDREKKEEEERQRQEERRREEEFKEKRNNEIDKTLALVNEAEDYAIACKIRAYIEAVSSKENLSDEDKNWIDWAKRKADWYDPTVKLYDEFLGERQHSKDEEYKKLKKTSYGWW
jgi:hypothetical protein